MKNFLASLRCFLLFLLILNVNANDFCSAFNLINHIQTKFVHKQNVTSLLMQTQKIAAYTVQKLYGEIKSEYGPHLEKALASSDNKTVDVESLATMGRLFGENSPSEFGANDLLDLCDMSQTYDETYAKLSQSVRFVVDDVIKELDSLFNKERSDILDKIFADNVSS
jgi:hypothetical protein